MFMRSDRRRSGYCDAEHQRSRVAIQRSGALFCVELPALALRLPRAQQGMGILHVVCPTPIDREHRRRESPKVRSVLQPGHRGTPS